MNVIIKVLKGEECNISVSPEMTVSELKQKVEKVLKIPVAHQKILLLGRALVDENKISSYPNIKDGMKLTLVVKKPDPLRDVILRCFQRYYNEQQSESLTNEFMNDFEKKVKQFSLDDIERIAVGFNAQQGND